MICNNFEGEADEYKKKIEILFNEADGLIKEIANESVIKNNI